MKPGTPVLVSEPFESPSGCLVESGSRGYVCGLDAPAGKAWVLLRARIVLAPLGRLKALGWPSRHSGNDPIATRLRGPDWSRLAPTLGGSSR